MRNITALQSTGLLVTPFLIASLLAPPVWAAESCTNHQAALGQAAGANLSSAELGPLHNLVVNDILTGDPPILVPVTSVDMALLFDLAGTAYFELHNGFSIQQLASEMGWTTAVASEFATTVMSNTKADFRSRLLAVGAYEAVGQDLVLRDMNGVVLPALIEHLSLDGCLSSALKAEFLAFLAETWETPAAFTASLNARFGQEGWTGSDRLAADAALQVGLSSIAFWTDPANPGGETPVPFGSWGDAAAADTVGGAVGALVGALIGIGLGAAITVGTGGAGAGAIIAGAKIGAAVGGLAGAAGTSVVVKVKEDAPGDCQCDCPCA